MRILFINTSEQAGGAAIAAARLMKALNRGTDEARMLVRDGTGETPGVRLLPPSLPRKLKFVAERAEICLLNGGSRKHLWAIDHGAHGTDITRLPEFEQSDVVHLHWVNQAMLSLGDIGRVLASGKPVVWTLHDMWPCTGICHQSAGCQNWLTGCGNCPLLRFASPGDLSASTFRRKQRAFGKGRMQVVACSDWLADIARTTPLLKHHPVASIPNPIDTNLFTPSNKMAARRRLGLPEGKRLVLFVAFRATDENKGISYLRRAMNNLCQDAARREEYGVVPVGIDASTLQADFCCKVYPFEYVADALVMRDLYTAADLLAMPTLMDNLPNTIVEAMACGLPCVAFRVGGVPQMIVHKADGYLAEYKSEDDLARGMEWVVRHPAYAQLSAAARAHAEREYSESVVASRYREVYNQAVARAKGATT